MYFLALRYSQYGHRFTLEKRRQFEERIRLLNMVRFVKNVSCERNSVLEREWQRVDTINL